MFGALTKRFQEIFAKMAGEKKLSEENIADAVREVRLALLDADVNYGVVSQFIRQVKEKAQGASILKAVSAHEQFIKIVHDELVALLGSDEPTFELRGSPAVILLCGLQGSGKTTQTAKLAAYLKRKQLRQKPLIAACDLQRPAAVAQLRRLCEQIEVPLFTLEGETDPVKVAKKGLQHAQATQCDVLILDTAGRLHVDTPLMEELAQIKAAVGPSEILFVANATTGQDAAKVAAEFHQKIGITGSILTMLDGNARAGAALSIRAMTHQPLKFEGVGERIEDLQLFNAQSMADRILGMGDVINLVRKAEEHITDQEKEELEKKLRKASFTYEDYLKQMKMMRKMGPLKSLLKMLPGVSDEVGLDVPENEFNRVFSIILSMTPQERQERVELVPNRRRRIASGSGTSLDEVNRMVKGFKRMKTFFKDMPAMKQEIKKGNMLWH